MPRSHDGPNRPLQASWEFSTRTSRFGNTLRAVALATACLIISTGCGSDREYSVSNETVNIEFELWNGDTATLAGLIAKDGRPLVVNLWATWCTPCLEEMPDLQAAHESVGAEVRFVGLNVSDSPTRSAQRAEELGITYLLGRDPDGTFSEALGAVGLPVTAFVEPLGQVVRVHYGPIDVDLLMSTIRTQLESVS